MELRQIKPCLSFIKKGNRDILQQICINNAGLQVTDLESFILIKDKFGLSNGLHNFDTLGLVDSFNNSDDYPLIDFNYNVDQYFTTNVKTLQEFIPYCSKDETRLNLNGICVHPSGMVATDGHKLLWNKIPNSLQASYILPLDGLKKLVRLLKKFKIRSDFSIYISNNFAFIDNGHFTFKMRLILREFPKWQNIIPKSFNKRFIIDNWINFKELKPLFDKRNYACKIFNKDEKVYLEIKESKTVYEIGYTLVTDKIEIGFNCEYLDLALKEPNNGLDFNSELAPVMIDQIGTKAIVMPLKL